MFKIVIKQDITQDNKIKLIKNEAITRGGDNNTGRHVWHSTSIQANCSGTNCDWEHSTLYNDLNGSYYVTNSYYVDSTNSWDNKILSINWKYGSVKVMLEMDIMLTLHIILKMHLVVI